MSHTRVVVVIGASTGLGLSIAIQSAGRDFTQLKTQSDPDGKLLQAKVVNDMFGGLV